MDRTMRTSTRLFAKALGLAIATTAALCITPNALSQDTGLLALPQEPPIEDPIDDLPGDPIPCSPDLIIVEPGEKVTILFEPPLQTAPSEVLVYETIIGQFIETTPSMITWIPTHCGWDYIQVRAVDEDGNSRVIVRLDFTGDSPELSQRFDLTVHPEHLGLILPLNEGGESYTATLLGRSSGQRARRCQQLPRPQIPPGMTCAQLDPDPNKNWICTGWLVAETYPSRPRRCGGLGGVTTVTVCGTQATELAGRIGLDLRRVGRCVELAGGLRACVAAGGCISIQIQGNFDIKCEHWRTFEVERCIRLCCRNGVVECCEQHRKTRICTYVVWHFPPPIGSIKTPPVCTPPAGPFVENCGD